MTIDQALDEAAVLAHRQAPQMCALTLHRIKLIKERRAQRAKEAETMTLIPADCFQCSNCHGIFPKGLSDEEAEAQRAKEFPDIPSSEMVVVCDDCYEKMKAYFEAHPEALRDQ